MYELIILKNLTAVAKLFLLNAIKLCLKLT